MTLEQVYKNIKSKMYDKNHNQFKNDALLAFGFQNHPKKDKIFNYAWEKGHSAGFSEVLNELIDLQDLFLD